jgi:hypothetical protein
MADQLRGRVDAFVLLADRIRQRLSRAVLRVAFLELRPQAVQHEAQLASFGALLRIAVAAAGAVLRRPAQRQGVIVELAGLAFNRLLARFGGAAQQGRCQYRQQDQGFRRRGGCHCRVGGIKKVMSL